ncbi:hypothetical protein FRC03_012755 [Tulasnella sp. 419]|nr:hypothetical protein FRC03_012755 [Tulasnella sp. 419]
MQSFIFLRSPLHDSGGHLHHIRRNTIHLASFLNRRRLSQTRNIGTFTISWNSPQIRRLPRSKAFLWTDVFEMQRRTKASSSSKPVNSGHSHDHDHDHSHSHSHGGLFHSHSHDAGHSHAGDAQATAEALTKVFKGEGLDKGTKVTLLGLFSNVGLTAVKGAAGWYFHSAALLAEAGHSLSDLLADFVALASWRTSRRPPSDEYPYGFGKFESFGTATVSILLIGGALAIGYHSYNTFLHVLAPTVSSLPPGLAHDILTTFINSNITALDAAAGILPHSHAHGHSHTAHSHGEVDLLDPNAAWFALASVIIKEWVYRVTKKVADEEKSPVLEANALHHRSDAYSSGVALIAILGTWAVPGLPLDSIGGRCLCFRLAPKQDLIKLIVFSVFHRFYRHIHLLPDFTTGMVAHATSSQRPHGRRCI